MTQQVTTTCLGNAARLQKPTHELSQMHATDGCAFMREKQRVRRTRDELRSHIGQILLDPGQRFVTDRRTPVLATFAVTHISRLPRRIEVENRQLRQFADTDRSRATCRETSSEAVCVA